MINIKRSHYMIKKTGIKLRLCLYSIPVYVRMKGLEPPRREAPDPKSGAATNYATSAFFLGTTKIRKNRHVQQSKPSFKESN